MLSAEDILRPAPRALVNYRSSRFEGTLLSLSLDHFSAADRATIVHLYDMLSTVRTLSGDESLPLAERVSRLADLADSPSWLALFEGVRSLGVHTTYSDTALHQVLHDLRGGAFTALAGQLEWFVYGWGEEHHVLPVFLLARDHLKIMRNMITDLDDTVRRADASFKLHGIDLLTEKWSNSQITAEDKTSRVQYTSLFTGDIAERCLEMSALDRVLYNLLNNAARHNAGEIIQLFVVPLPDSPDLRFAVANPITPQAEEYLTTTFGNRLSSIFEGGFSTTGSGLGMRICADVVSNAYGVGSTTRLIDQGYVAATLQNGMFVTWFHWPVAGI